MATTMYVPLSPAHSVHAYEPESPARSEKNVFFPESPARSEKNVFFPESPRKTTQLSFLERLLNPPSIKETKPLPYRPIYNWRSYVRQYMFNEKSIFKNIENEIKLAIKRNEIVKINTLIPEYNRALKVFEKAKEYVANISFNERKIEYEKSERLSVFKVWKHDICNIEDKKPCEKINVSNDPTRVILKTTVNEDGHISVKLSAPLAELYEKYHANLMKPPRDEYLRALKEFGYPQWYINKHSNKINDGPKKTVQDSLLENKTKKSKKKTSTLEKFKQK